MNFQQLLFDFSRLIAISFNCCFGQVSFGLSSVVILDKRTGDDNHPGELSSAVLFHLTGELSSAVILDSLFSYAKLETTIIHVFCGFKQ